MLSTVSLTMSWRLILAFKENNTSKAPCALFLSSPWRPEFRDGFFLVAPGYCFSIFFLQILFFFVRYSGFGTLECSIIPFCRHFVTFFQNRRFSMLNTVSRTMSWLLLWAFQKKKLPRLRAPWMVLDRFPGCCTRLASRICNDCMILSMCKREIYICKKYYRSGIFY